MIRYVDEVRNTELSTSSDTMKASGIIVLYIPIIPGVFASF